MMELRTDRFKLKDLISGNEEKGLENMKEANPSFAKTLTGYAQKLHMKLDDIEYVRKGIPIDPKDITVEEGERAAIRLVTTAHLDRDGEILIPSGAILDDFKQSPSVLFAHDYKSLPIGSDKWIKITNLGILAKTFYAKHQFAEDVYQCVKDKHLNSNSVGFIPIEAVPPEEKERFNELQDILEKDFGIDREESGKAKNIYAKWLMLEHSDVPVASNAASLNLAVGKGLLIIHSKQLKKDLEIELEPEPEDREIEIVKDMKKNEESYEKAVEKVDREIGLNEEKTVKVTFKEAEEKTITREFLEDLIGEERVETKIICKKCELAMELYTSVEKGFFFKCECGHEVEAKHVSEKLGTFIDGDGVKRKFLPSTETNKKGEFLLFGKPMVDIETGKPLKKGDLYNAVVEEAKEDITELLTIEDEEQVKAKALEVIERHELGLDTTLAIFSSKAVPSSLEVPMGHIVNALEDKYNLKVTFDKEGKVVIVTKPEETETQIRIPVNPGCKITATITISKKEGITALYCGQKKIIHTYIFLKSKGWTTESARKWVSEHKSLSEEVCKCLTIGINDFKPSDEHREIIRSIAKEIDNQYMKDLPEDEKHEFFNKVDLLNEEDGEPAYHERWNKSLSKLFDVEAVESSAPKPFNYALYEKFLECKVKEIFQNGYLIPSPLLGTYLAGFKAVLSKFKLKDTRNFLWNGVEVPPSSAMIKLNSKEEDDFLVEGIQFFDADGKPLIVGTTPTWYGIKVEITTAIKNKKWNKALMDEVHSWVDENNYLRNEKFALSGEFLEGSDDSWDNLIMEKSYKDSITKTVNQLEKKGAKLLGRGLLFIGPPGTGKTKTGRVMINEMKSTFIWVSSRDFKKIGSLQALTMAFSLARDLAPTVLFIEDIDTWLKDYGDRDSVVVDLIKTEMDGIRQNKGIVTVLTSNYPEKLPDALLDRPGRFHHIVNFELPKAEQREEMLKMWAGDIDEKLVEEIVEKTEGFSGAHMKELVDFASMIAEEDEIEIGDALVKSLRKLTEQRELIDEIRQNKPEAKSLWKRIEYKDGELTIKEDKIITMAKKKEEKTKGIDKSSPEYKALSDSEKKYLEVALKEREPEKGETFELGEGFEEQWRGKLEELGAIESVRVDDKGGKKLIGKMKAEIKEEKEETVDTTADLDTKFEMLSEQIAELKAGRVFSRKNRNLLKQAHIALGELLKADAAGTAEDDETAEEDEEKKVLSVDIVMDGKSGDKEKDAVVKMIGDKMAEMLTDENIKKMFGKQADKAAKTAVSKITGKVE